MRQHLILVILFAIFVCGGAFANGLPEPASTDAMQPSTYEKWGRLAVTETKKRYPDASIIDYLHIGRTNVSTATFAEQFKLWLRKVNGQEFGVIVTILVNKATDAMEKIDFEETDRGRGN